MYKGYKIRLFPNKAQEELMWKHINCCRYIWNYMLAKQEENHKVNHGQYSRFDFINLLTSLKNDGEHDWLYECSNTSYQIICSDLAKARQKFFEHKAKYPKFKTKKKSKKSFPVDGVKMWFDTNYKCHILKIGKVKFKTDLDIPITTRPSVKFINPRITYEYNKWILSFELPFENQEDNLKNGNMGIDLGVKDLMIVSFDDQLFKIPNINKSIKIKKIQHEIKQLQKNISRKYNANRDGNLYFKTNNIIKQELKLNKLYNKISNIRLNYIHHCTRMLVNMNPQRIIVEDLNIMDLLQTKNYSESLKNARFYEILRQLSYKSEWAGINFIKADRFFPSSKKCSCCGNIKRHLSVDERTYACDICGITLDRDYNAAINLSRYEVG